MADGFLQRALGAHRMVAGSGSRAPHDATALAVDTLVFDAGAAPPMMRAFERLGASRVSVEALAALSGEPARVTAHPGDRTAECVSWCRERGVRIAHAGTGSAELVARETLAAPGRVLAGAGLRLAGCGAVGALSIEVTEDEAAACLAGLPLFRTVTVIATVWLSGLPRPGVGAVEVVAGLLRAGVRGGAVGGVMPFAGPGVANLPMEDRIAIALLARDHLEASALFPSDESTRRWLESRGRATTWKALGDEDASGADAVRIELGGLEVAVIEIGEGAAPIALSRREGAPVAEVVLGPEATLEDLEGFARMLDGRAARARMWLVPGSRGMVDALRERGLLEALERSGARILESGMPPDEGDGATLCAGVPLDLRSGAHRPWLVAGPPACAASAIAGVLRAADRARPAVEPAPFALALEEPGRPDTPSAPPAGGHPPDEPAHAAPAGPMRLSVALALGDHVTARDVLPWGARLEPLRHDVRALAAHCFSGLDPGFAARARAAGGAVLAAGRDLGAGDAHPAAAPALRELGVRAVVALSVAPAFRHRLVEVGILPLALLSDGDRGALAAGDELEIPPLDETPGPVHTVTVRNLTRGTRVVLAHDLDPLEAAVVRAGGLLRLARHERGRWARVE